MQNTYLLGNSITIADIGIMPFVCQFAHVDRDIFLWFALPEATDVATTLVGKSVICTSHD